MLLTWRSFEEYVAFIGLDPDRLPPPGAGLLGGDRGFVSVGSEFQVGAHEMLVVAGAP